MDTKTKSTHRKDCLKWERECFNLSIGALAGALSDRLAYLRTLEAVVRRIKIINDENSNEWARAASELNSAMVSFNTLCDNLHADKRVCESLVASAADARTRRV